MIKLIGSVPRTVCVAVSGGSDSMSALHFLRNNTSRTVIALYFNHGTEHADEAELFVRQYCHDNAIPLVTGKVTRSIENGESKEAYWRSERYRFFESWMSVGGFTGDMKLWDQGSFIRHFSRAPIVTCHHLDDAVETWIFTSLHGQSRLIPYKRDNFIRPFLMTRKSELTYWCERHDVPYISDPSNDETMYMRNFIRHELMPKALHVNPGIHKVVRKKIEKEYKDNIDIV